jgi:ElaB/YqjD/DUF883 family membrane-anchored ribosome-binding protein
MARTTEHASSSATERVREKAAEAAQNIRDIGGDVQNAAREQFDNFRSSAGDYYEQGRDRAMEWEESIESYVQEKPLKALAIAAGVGLLIGLFWRRR